MKTLLAFLLLPRDEDSINHNMCGRAAYSSRAVSAAATVLNTADCHSGGVGPKNSSVGEGDCDEKPSPRSQHHHQSTAININVPNVQDNNNMSPGNVAHVFRRNPTSATHTIECTPMIWGLIPQHQHGTHLKPHHVPSHPQFSASPHYTMFNARSETIYEKPSFSGLISSGQTCVFAVDGYYEWTTTPTDIEKRKQPYFVCNKDKSPLFLAGLWSCVKTGRDIIQGESSGDRKDETIATFTILTTHAHHPSLSWLHPRQPVILWDGKTVLEWLLRPNRKLVEKFLAVVPLERKREDDDNQQQKQPHPTTLPRESALSVYPVTKRMSDGKYHGQDCTTEVKLATVPDISTYFTCGGGSTTKRTKVEQSPMTAEGSPPKRLKVDTFNPSYSPTMKHKQTNIPPSPVKDEEHGKKDLSWACSSCTFIHVGKSKANYLSCEVCGCTREHDAMGTARQSSSPAAWGSLRSPSK